MTIEYFTTFVVPLLASVVYLVASVGSFWVDRPVMGTMWLCYSVANICLLLTVKQ